MDLNILENIPHNIAVVDREGILVYGNTNFTRFMESAFGRAIAAGQSLLERIPADRRLQCRLRIEEVLAGQCLRLEEEYEQDGEVRYFDVAYQPLPAEGGEAEQVILLFEEITTRKLRRLRLQEVNAELRELVATRDTLLSVISHELRSPIFQLNGLLFLIRQAAGSRDEARLQMQAEDLQERISHLTHTIDNLLQWASMQRQNLEPRITRFELGPVVEHAVGLMKPIASRKGLQVKVEGVEDLQMESDREMVAFIVRNLLNNAIKFSRQSGRIELRAQVTEMMVRLAVQDDGVGFDPEKLRSARWGSGSGSQPGTWGEQGTGIGLQLCFEFAERLHGTLTVESTPGSGSTVTLRLPRQAS